MYAQESVSALQRKSKEFLKDHMYEVLAQKPIANSGHWKDQQYMKQRQTHVGACLNSKQQRQEEMRSSVLANETLANHVFDNRLATERLSMSQTANWKQKQFQKTDNAHETNAQQKRQSEFSGGVWDLPQYDSLSVANKKLPV